MNTSYSYPQKRTIITDWEKSSNYIIKIVAPTDMSVAFHEYSSNFFNAAHIISNSLINDNQRDISKLDTYFFAIAFLYRHSIELILKAIAFKYVISTSDRSKFVRDTFHNLEEILSKVHTISPSSRQDEEIRWLKNFFENISTIDKESDSFRYPFHIISKRDEFSETKYSIKKIFEKETHIDLVKFANKFEAAYEILDKWYMENRDEATEWKSHTPLFLDEGGLYYGQSVVGYSYSSDDFYPYSEAYFETACLLKEYMKEEIDAGKYNKVNGLFLPMCYLYRNCTELNLKTIWFEETREDFQKCCKIMMKKKHSIIGMWNTIKPIIEVCADEKNDIEYIETVEYYCEQLHKLDSDSSKFRYPSQKNMEPYFRKNVRLDFLNFGTFVEALNNALDGISSTLELMTEFKAEMDC